MRSVRDAASRQGLLSVSALGLLSAALATTVLIAVTAPLLESGLIDLPYSGSALRQTGYLSILVVVLAAAWTIVRSNILQSVPIALTAYMFWIASSILWSEDATLSFKRLALFYIVTAIMLLTVRTLGFERSVRTLTIVLYIVTLANIVSVVVAPRVALNYHPHPILDYQWRGLMAGKNLAGAVSALTVCFVLYPSFIRSAGVRVLAALPPAVVLICSMSRTAMVSLVAAGAIVALAMLCAKKARPISANRPARRQLLLWFPFASIVLSAFVVSLKLDMFADLFKDRTIVSNRGSIWWPLLQEYSEHPTLGVGYGAFWSDGQANNSVSGNADWLAEVTQAHNGYLEVLLQVGLIGLILALLAAYVSPISDLVKSHKTHPQQSLLVTGLLAFCLISNLSESGLLSSDSVWSIFILVAIALARVLANDQRQLMRRSREGVVGRRRRRDRETVREQHASSSI
jgi:O-antigen ligase